MTQLFVLIFCWAIGSLLIIALRKREATVWVASPETHQGLVRWSTAAKPRIGGFIFFSVFLLTIGISYYFFPQFFPQDKSLWFLLAATTLAFVLGWWDDVKNVPPIVKSIGQFFCAQLLYSGGFELVLSPWNELNYIFTILWVVGIMNSLNMLDNMDGIAASVALFIVLIMLYANYMQGNNSLILFLCLPVIGSLLAFLQYNWHPSKIYMGDAGSQFLGVFLAAIALKTLIPQQSSEALATQGAIFHWGALILPFVVFSLMIIDTATVTVRRIRRGQSPFVGGKDHTTHNLAFLGLKDAQVAWSFVFFSVINFVWVVLYYHFSLQNVLWFKLLMVAYVLLLAISIQWVYYYNQKEKNAYKKRDKTSIILTH
ncbi:MAG: MraY family glycosyltransferase [Chitinophagales bacterium]|nr:undecaprenyl/decaprenyl-phosphate alpha-N-acetylglucosaminyl 1-phosphate transferase [Bacteroidota bacterium]MCB9043543.1 undecaprenyl/decaprenyl-phosphate alpha-N-acetylglucosaminyl 1-phosphate transferase [Chitinophagales bacterium]